MTDQQLNNTCASFQQAVIDVVVEKTITAARTHTISSVILGGGVSANSSLRQQMTERCHAEGFELYLPALQNCTDNGAMIAFAGLQQFLAGERGAHDDDVYSRSPLGR